MVTTLKNFLTSLLFGSFSAFILFACNKDASPETPQPENNQSQNISIEEIKLIYGDLNTEGYAQSRSGAQLPLDVLPAWSSAYSYSNAPMPVIMVPVDTASLHQDNRQGGNLVFFKNNIGVIQCILLMWQANSSTDYTSNKAPLDLASQFSGMMLLVDVQNNIRRIMEVNSGVVIKAKEGSISILEIGGENLSNNAAQDRDPKCPKWGPNWWDRVWNWMGNVFDGILDFFGNIWDNGVGHESLPAGTFIFGGQGGINTFGYTDPGSSSIREQQLAAQMTTCQAIREYMESIGETPSGYSDTDLRFCQLVNELGLNGQQNACLFNQYGTSYINELYEYWATSDQSLATTEKIKEYIDLKCSGGFSALLTDMAKEQFCLSQNPIDLMEKIKNHCGYSSYESSEWYGDFNNGLSACVQEAIIEDRIGYIESRYGAVVTAAELEVITEGDPYSCDALSKIDFAYATILDDAGEGITNLAARLNCFTISGNENYINRVTISVDQPVPGQIRPYNENHEVGHTFVTLEQISPTGAVTRLTFGLYPTTGVKPKINPIAPGLFVHDENHHFDVSMSWDLTPANFVTLVNNAKSIALTYPTFNLNDYNCTTFALTLLNQIGLGIPQNEGTWPGGGGLNPGRLGQDLREMTLQPWMARNTTGGYAPASVGCP